MEKTQNSDKEGQKHVSTPTITSFYNNTEQNNSIIEIPTKEKKRNFRIMKNKTLNSFPSFIFHLRSYETEIRLFSLTQNPMKF